MDALGIGGGKKGWVKGAEMGEKAVKAKGADLTVFIFGDPILARPPIIIHVGPLMQRLGRVLHR